MPALKYHLRAKRRRKMQVWIPLTSAERRTIERGNSPWWFRRDILTFHP